MKLSIWPCGWGKAKPQDIKRLLNDAASHLLRLLRTPFDGEIVVKPAPEGAQPDVLYRASHEKPFVIRLATRDYLWSQFAFQFSHELCHVLSDHERLAGNPNNWFHEAVCELGSLFVLRRMAEQWPTRPPYPHWADYAPSLMKYAQDRLSRPETQTPEGVTLQAWLPSREEQLRQNPYQRSMNEVVAYALLPIFESEPTGWNAIGRFPSSSSGLADYLSDWYSAVDAADRPFVARLSYALGHKIAAPGTPSPTDDVLGVTTPP